MEDLSARAEELWGLPDAEGRYLVAIVVHGDDASEEDYSVVGNRLLGAINQAAREYGYDFSAYNRSEYFEYVTSPNDDPLVARLADGTLIAATSRSRRGPGWNQDTRRPTPKEHALWAGLPVPPEPAPAPPAEPELIDVVWGRLKEHSGATFTTRRGLTFRYDTFPWNLWVTRADGRGTSLDRHMIYAALEVWPASGPTALPEECGYGQRSYIWGLLADPRILGLQTPLFAL